MCVNEFLLKPKLNSMHRGILTFSRRKIKKELTKELPETLASLAFHLYAAPSGDAGSEGADVTALALACGKAANAGGSGCVGSATSPAKRLCVSDGLSGAGTATVIVVSCRPPLALLAAPWAPTGITLVSSPVEGST